ncbi:MAG: amino acid adenylation domain-containing protein, partial [Bacteroidota bacterium]
LDPEDSFLESYQKIKQTTLDGFSHQSYPFDNLVEDLELQYDMSRTPVYDISLTLHNTSEISQYTLSDPDLQDEVEDLGFGLCKNDIEFHFQESKNETFFGATFNSDLYDLEMMRSLMTHFKHLLSQMLAKPNIPLGELDYLAEAARVELTETFNDTFLKYPMDKTVLDLFRTQVQKTPQATAIKFKDESLSYKQLDVLSNQLGHCLLDDYGVKKGDLIGIQLDRSHWFVVAILGILKSGGAYVPMDPEYPVQRKEHMIKDAGIELLLSDTSYMFDMDYYQGTLLALDVEFTPEDYSAEAAGVLVTPTDLAYVIYTSGSTGTPKGVLIAHDSLSASIHARNHFYEFMKSYLLVPSFSFDSSVAVLWECLTRGSTLFVVASMDLKNPVTMIDLIKEHEIASVLCVPSFYKFLLEENKSSELTFKRVILAGETLRKSLVNKHYAVLPTSNLFNEYGPTENTVWSTATLIPKKIKRVTIGKPISNTKVFILDENHQLVPKGVVGELYLTGNNLAVGYLNRPELTKEKFISDLILKGERYYKTGDLGRWMPDGTIDFIGRKDDQVKIRGYRIELGEIENRIKGKQEVKDVVVLARDVLEGEKELVAYVVSGALETTADLRNYLSSSLPEYMIPAYYVQLEEIPLTANGKIDKKSLPIPDEINMLRGVEYVAPRTEVEEQVVEIWQQLLKREKIGIKDDYFALGGNSLLAMQLINEYHKAFDVKIEIKDLFENSTVEDFVTFLNFVLKQKSFDANTLNEIDL